MIEMDVELDAKKLMELIEEETKKIDELTKYNEKKHNPENSSLFKEFLNFQTSQNEDENDENSDNQSDMEESDSFDESENEINSSYDGSLTSEYSENENFEEESQINETNRNQIVNSLNDDQNEDSNSTPRQGGDELETISLDLDDMLIHLITLLQHKTGLKMNFKEAYEFIMRIGATDNLQ